MKQRNLARIVAIFLKVNIEGLVAREPLGGRELFTFSCMLQCIGFDSLLCYSSLRLSSRLNFFVVMHGARLSCAKLRPMFSFKYQIVDAAPLVAVLETVSEKATTRSLKRCSVVARLMQVVSRTVTADTIVLQTAPPSNLSEILASGSASIPDAVSEAADKGLLFTSPGFELGELKLC